MLSAAKWASVYKALMNSLPVDVFLKPLCSTCWPETSSFTSDLQSKYQLWSNKGPTMTVFSISANWSAKGQRSRSHHLPRMCRNAVLEISNFSFIHCRRWFCGTMLSSCQTESTCWWWLTINAIASSSAHLSSGWACVSVHMIHKL